MSKKDELDGYREQGERHATNGDDCPPSDRMSECFLRDKETNLTEADNAYQEGRDRVK